MVNKKSGVLFDIKKFSSDDGPGIRTTFFLKGCPLKCVWCHNPESQKIEPELIFNEEKCIRCGKCVTSCSQNAQILKPDGERIIIREKCINCFDCVKNCPTTALEVSGKNFTVEDVMQEVKKDILFYKNSGGGVTFSGGEPTFQAAFLYELLSECKKLDIHTALDTCGYFEFEEIKLLIKYVDLFLYDIKHMNTKLHKKYTGVSNEIILRNLEKIKREGKQIIISIPLIPGYNDSERNIKETIKFIKKYSGQVRLLPYNETTDVKYLWLGRRYMPNDLKNLSNEKLNKIVNLITESGLKVSG